MNETLPRGIALLPDGRFRVRINRDNVQHSGGAHALLGDAVAALEKLTADLPPARTGRKRRKPIRGRVPQGTSMKYIYPTGSGWRVVLMRGTTEHYIGHYQVLAEAIADRDQAEIDYPLTRTKR